MSREITLGLGGGEVTVPVRQQSMAYVLHEGREFFKRASTAVDAIRGDDEISVDRVIVLLGEYTYDALKTLIPTLPEHMPEYRFRGYATRDQMQAGDVDPVALREAPSLPQIRAAFHAGMEENGLDVKGLLDGWLDPKVREALTADLLSLALSMISPSSPPATGESESNGSGTDVPASPTTAPQASPA